MSSDALNVPARLMMSRLMRAFAAGQMTNDEFEDAALALCGRDAAVNAACEFAWFYYCDMRTHRLTGKWRLGRDARRLWALWVLLLRTEAPVREGMELSFASSCVGCLVMSGLILAVASTLPGTAGMFATLVVAAVLVAGAWHGAAWFIRHVKGRHTEGDNSMNPLCLSPFRNEADEQAARRSNVFLCGRAA